MPIMQDCCLIRRLCGNFCSFDVCLQASINELEVVIDESNAQIKSLNEQLSSAQQRLDTSETDGTALQSTIATLQQEVQSAQVNR